LVDSLLLATAVILGAVGLGSALLAVRTPLSLRIAVRNIRRARSRSILVILGLLVGTAIVSGSLVVGDTVYYGTAGAPQYFISQKASLGALDRQTGALKWRKPIPLLEKGYVSGIAGSLAYADGKILVANLDGTLSAYQIPRPAPAGGPP
jgi:outer membrane protein assembly factor BamB